MISCCCRIKIAILSGLSDVDPRTERSGNVGGTIKLLYLLALRLGALGTLVVGVEGCTGSS